MVTFILSDNCSSLRFIIFCFSNAIPWLTSGAWWWRQAFLCIGLKHRCSETQGRIDLWPSADRNSKLCCEAHNSGSYGNYLLCNIVLIMLIPEEHVSISRLFTRHPGNLLANLDPIGQLSASASTLPSPVILPSCLPAPPPRDSSLYSSSWYTSIYVLPFLHTQILIEWTCTTIHCRWLWWHTGSTR